MEILAIDIHNAFEWRHALDMVKLSAMIVLAALYLGLGAIEKISSEGVYKARSQRYEAQMSAAAMAPESIQKTVNE